MEAAFSDLRPNLALTYPFELDTFQKEAVVHLERNNSVRWQKRQRCTLGGIFSELAKEAVVHLERNNSVRWQRAHAIKFTQKYKINR